MTGELFTVTWHEPENDWGIYADSFFLSLYNERTGEDGWSTLWDAFWAIIGFCVEYKVIGDDITEITINIEGKKS